jgi:hypothetical protein
MGDTEQKTPKVLMAWYLCVEPSKAVKHINIGDEASFAEALEFGAWCIAASLAMSAVIAGVGAKEEDLFTWRQVVASSVAADGIILYPFLRLLSWEKLRFQSFVHVYCYVLTFTVLKLLSFYVAKSISAVALLVPIFSIWSMIILAYLLWRVLGFHWLKFLCVLLALALVSGFAFALVHSH